MDKEIESKSRDGRNRSEKNKYTAGIGGKERERERKNCKHGDEHEKGIEESSESIARRGNRKVGIQEDEEGMVFRGISETEGMMSQ